MPRPFVIRPSVVLAAWVGAVAVLLVASAAAAHSTTGALELVSIEPAGGEMAQVTVRFRYEGDEHPVLDGVVQMGGRRSDGVTLLPVAFSPTDVPGRLVAGAALPGPDPWDLRITSTEPAAELRVTFDPSNPGAAPGTAEGGEFTSGGDVDGLPWRWVVLGCAAVLGVFSLVRWRGSQ